MAAERVRRYTAVRIDLEDYRFLTEYNPERERSASRRDLVSFIEEMQAILRGDRD